MSLCKMPCFLMSENHQLQNRDIKEKVINLLLRSTETSMMTLVLAFKLVEMVCLTCQIKRICQDSTNTKQPLVVYHHGCIKINNLEQVANPKLWTVKPYQQLSFPCKTGPFPKPDTRTKPASIPDLKVVLTTHPLTFS